VPSLHPDPDRAVDEQAEPDEEQVVAPAAASQEPGTTADRLLEHARTLRKRQPR
jgi:hypothetical protein